MGFGRGQEGLTQCRQLLHGESLRPLKVTLRVAVQRNGPLAKFGYGRAGGSHLGLAVATQGVPLALGTVEHPTYIVSALGNPHLVAFWLKAPAAWGLNFSPFRSHFDGSSWRPPAGGGIGLCTPCQAAGGLEPAAQEALLQVMQLHGLASHVSVTASELHAGPAWERATYWLSEMRLRHRTWSKP